MVSAVIIIVLVFATVGTVVFLKLRQTGPAWKKIPLSGGAQYTGEVNDVLLVGAFFKARELLWTKTNFPQARVNSACQSISIKILSVDSWLNSVGQKVGGETTIPFCPTIGRDLSSLLHEIVHCVEWSCDGAYDMTHTTWAARGVWAADNEFRAWLLAQVPAPLSALKP